MRVDHQTFIPASDAALHVSSEALTSGPPWPLRRVTVNFAVTMSNG